VTVGLAAVVAGLALARMTAG